MRQRRPGLAVHRRNERLCYGPRIKPKIVMTAGSTALNRGGDITGQGDLAMPAVDPQVADLLRALLDLDTWEAVLERQSMHTDDESSPRGG